MKKRKMLNYLKTATKLRAETDKYQGKNNIYGHDTIVDKFSTIPTEDFTEMEISIRDDIALQDYLKSDFLIIKKEVNHFRKEKISFQNYIKEKAINAVLQNWYGD